MKQHALAALVVLAAAAAWTPFSSNAQPLREPKVLLLDQSSEELIDAASAKAVLEAKVPAKVWKVYPQNRWTFLSQVTGGMTAQGICVVSARVVLLPRTSAVRAVLWRPKEVATAFDAKPGATLAECKALARDKLETATAAVVDSLVRN